MITVFEICGELFTTRELCVQSIKLTHFSLPVKVVANVELTLVTILDDRTSEFKAQYPITPRILRDQPEHL